MRTCTPRFYILGTAEPIVLKFATWVGANWIGGFQKAMGWSLSTCARAHPASISQELVDRLSSNLDYGLELIRYVTYTSSAGGGVAEHVRTCTLRLFILGTAEPFVFKFATWGLGLDDN